MSQLPNGAYQIQHQHDENQPHDNARDFHDGQPLLSGRVGLGLSQQLFQVCYFHGLSLLHGRHLA